MCLSVLVVVGVGFSEVVATDCAAIDAMIVTIDSMLITCNTFGDCDELEILRNDAVCVSGECWDFVDGVCSAE